MPEKLILAHQKVPTRLGALKDTDSEEKWFLPRSEVLAKHIKLNNNRIARLGTVTDDEFRAWMLGLIKAHGRSNHETYLIKAECETETLDEWARWDFVNRLYRLRTFRKLLFVEEGASA